MIKTLYQLYILKIQPATSILFSLRDQYDDALTCIARAAHIERQMNIRYFILSLKRQIKETYSLSRRESVPCSFTWKQLHRCCRRLFEKDGA